MSVAFRAEVDMRSASSQAEAVAKLVLATSAMLFTSVVGVLLDGSPNSHARFPAWIRRCGANVNWSVTLNFDMETRRSDCLVLYADNGLQEFVEVRLVRGTARLRLGAGRTLAAGSGLNDGRTHAVAVRLTDQLATLTVDRSSQSLTVHVSPTLVLPTVATSANFSVYVGGLPAEFRSGQHLEWLAAPSAAFEPAFVGSIRNVAYATRCGDDVEVVRMMSGSGVRSGVDDSCADYDPCQNSAPCLSTDEGPLCDCSFTDYVGPFCDLG